MNRIIFFNFVIILMIFNPTYQSCEEKTLNRNRYGYYNYEIICSELNDNVQLDCNDYQEFYLVLKPNNFSIIDKSLFNSDCDIVSISITNGKIAKIIPSAFSNYPYLRSIDLYGNNISSILDATFVNDNKLQVLNMSRNNIENIGEHGFYGLNNLQHLVLNHNHLKQFSFFLLKNVRLNTLDLSFNNITDIFSNIESDNFTVVSLDLSYNPIKNLSKDLLPDPRYLQYLNLSGIGVDQIPPKMFMDFHGLIALNLSHNLLSNLQFGLFNNLDDLRILDLSNNRLITNDLHTTLGLKALNEFYFHNNHISEFNMNLLPANLTAVSFYGNDFKFTCQHLSEIISNLHRKGIRITNGKQYENNNFNGIECKNNFNNDSTIDLSSSSKNNIDQVDFVKSIKTFNEKINYLIKANERSNDELKNANENLQYISQLIKDQNIKSKHDSINDYFETQFKQTNFYKFFKNFKAIEINTSNLTNISKDNNNNTGVMERLVSSYIANDEDPLLKSISVQFTIILILIVGTMIGIVILRRNWILNHIRSRNNRSYPNPESMNLTGPTGSSSMDSMEMQAA